MTRTDSVALIDISNGLKTQAVDELSDQDIDRVYSACESLMDHDIRESLHGDIAPCSNREFLAAYCREHKRKFGDIFCIG